MSRSSQPRQPRPAQVLADRAFSAVERFLHIEAVSGIVLIVAAAVALVWANSPAADSYSALWHTPLALGLGAFSFSRDLHFWINDGLMTIFFLVVGMEIRREIHGGALASLRQAALPLAAALGGVIAPALIFLAVNGGPLERQGWAVPTATDIAFAVGVLALLGKAIPAGVRILLLALAILDDIVAVLIIAAFYSGGLSADGLWAAGAGIGGVLLLQRIGIGSAWAYVAPGALLWLGLLQIGVHPTLAGVALGLLTPVYSRASRRPPLDRAKRAVDELRQAGATADHLARPLRRLRLAQREILPPVSRVQMALHPWVAYGAMPLFALANAGVAIGGVDLAAGGSRTVMLGIWLGLVCGKPLGIFAVSWLAVKLGWCSLPPGVTWKGVALVGFLGGIGFTMSIFIATLAFTDPNLLGAAKLGVLLASLAAALLGLAWGKVFLRSPKT